MWRITRRILSFTSPSLRWALNLWTAAASALMFADLLAITLVAVSVSSLAAGTSPAPTTPWSPGVGLGLAAAVLVVRGVLALAVQRGMAKCLAAIEIDLAGQLTDGYLNAQWLWISGRDSNRAMRMAETGVSRVVSWFVKPMFTSFSDVVGVVAISALVLVWNPVVGIAALAYGCLVTFVLFRVLSPRVAASGQASFAAEHEMQKRMSQAWAAAAEVRVFGLSQRFAADVKQARAVRARANASATAMTSSPQYLLEMALVTGLGLLSLAMVALGRADAVLGVVAVLAVVALRLLPSLLRLQSGMTMAKHNLVWAEQLLVEFDELAVIDADTEPALTPKDQALVRLSGVSVTYPGRDEPTLIGVDLTVMPGDRIGIIGASGAGKSTLTALLLGLIDPTAGTAEKSPVRAALLSQDAAILDGTIRENLVFARPWLADTDESRLRAALATAGLATEVDAFPAGLDTQVGESGRSLSGGQRQRLGLSRALLDEPQLLVLDEPTSQLDDQNAAWVRAAIEELSPDVAVVFVTHRPQLLDGFTRVLLVRDGRVVDTETADADRQRSKGA